MASINLNPGYSALTRPLAGQIYMPQIAPAVRFKPLARDTVHFGSSIVSKLSPPATYKPQLEVGTYGLPDGHLYAECFRAERAKSNPLGVAKIHSIKSLDPLTTDPAKAYACEVNIDLRDTKLAGKTTPGEHLSFLDISNAQQFPAAFKQDLKTQGIDYTFTATDLEKLKNARLKSFTIASPAGGERDVWGRKTGIVKLIVRRIDNGPMTNFMVNLKPGDALPMAGPMTHHFLGPTASTPAIFFGVGSSITPYMSMLRTRFTQEKGPYAETYLAIGHSNAGLEYFAKMFRDFAKKKKNHFTYRPIYSKQPQKSDGINRIQGLLNQESEAKKIISLVLNPQAHIYVSGFWGLDEQLVKAMRESVEKFPSLGVTRAQLDAGLKKARTEGRFHVEGEIRKDLTEGLQGY